MSNYPEIIGVDQLRDEIGDPTTNTQFAGYVSDVMLQNIIDRHIDWLESQAHQRVQEGQAKPVKRVDPVTISLSEQSTMPGVATGPLSADRFPYATEGIITSPSEYEGESLDYKPNLIREAKKVFYDAFFFDIEDDTVIAYPNDVTEVTLFCPPKDKAVREIMADMFAEVNQNIIQRARQMMQAREEEFAEPAFAGGEGVVQDD